MDVEASRRARDAAVLLLLLTCAAFGACAPGDDDLGVVECAAGLLPGDLVITEILANAPGGDGGDGGDGGGEWFEIHNRANAPVRLGGLVLGYTDGADIVQTHVMDDVELPGRGYLVLGAASGSAAPAHVDHGYGDALGPMAASGGTLTLKCDVIVVDAITYQALPAGTSMELASTLDPDADANDEWSSWCQGVTEFAPGLLGSPGAANECVTGTPAGACLDGESWRPTTAPVAGDLIITELMANPAAVGDATGEWFEVHVMADVDLNGLAFGRDPTNGADAVIDQPECWRVAAGQHLLFARYPDPASNGGLPPVDLVYDFSLVNADGSLFLAYGQGTVLDQVTWAASTSGAATNLDPGAYDPERNDDASSFCPATDNAYGDGDLGTPGAQNQACPAVVPPGSCVEAESGVVRAIVSPGPGDLVITELMANPDVIGDAQGEWIEVRADANVDLNGVELRKLAGSGTTGSSVIESPTCVRVDAGTHHVLVRDADPARNGCIAAAAAIFGLSLNNSDATLFLTADGVDIDAVRYATTSAGASASLDETTGQWCTNTTDVYDSCLSSANTGTPGARNPPCPAPLGARSGRRLTHLPP